MRNCILTVILITAFIALSGCTTAREIARPVAPETAEGLIYDATGGTWYDDAAEALASAGDGAVLYLCEDASTGALAVAAAGLTLDLQGHTLSINTVGSGARGGQGLAHDALSLGEGDFTVENGSIEVSVGANPETVQSAQEPYCGISAGLGELTFEAVDLSVTYAGASSISPAVELVAISTGGSLALQGASNVSVVSSSARGAFGATSVVGIDALSAEAADTFVVSHDSRIEVSNVSSQIIQGAVGYPSAIYGTTKESNAELVEIAVDDSVEWSDDLTRRFKANAKFDDKDDADGFIYGAEVYYAPALELENGLMLWVFSDPIEVDEAGKLDSIVPAHVFARSNYALPLDAIGIRCAEGFVGTVSQEGPIVAQTALGHAIGVYEAPSGSYEIDESVIEATCEDGSYRTNAGGFDLANFAEIDIDAGQALVYPQKSTFTAVRVESSSAWKTAVAGQETWEYDADPVLVDELFDEWDLYGEAPADPDGEDETTIGLSLTYYRMGADGYLYTGEEAGTYVYSPDLDLISVANERVKPGDVVEIGGEHVSFLGWSPRSSDKEPLYTDSITVAEESWGSFGARLALYGIYASATEAAPEARLAVQPDPVTPVAVEQLPSGGLEVASAQDDGMVRAGGVALLGAFVLVVALACGAWIAYGRALVTPGAGGDASEAGGEHGGSPSAEQQRKGGLFF